MSTAPASKVLLPGFHFSTNDASHPRVVIAVDGRERQGKTHFCLTAPSPIVYFDFDLGAEGVMGKADAPKREAPGKIIITTEPFISKPAETFDHIAKPHDREEAAQAHAEAEWKRFHAAFLKAVHEPVLVNAKGQKIAARTIVLDTGSETYEMLRLAYFGKLTQVPTFLYRETNSIMRSIVRESLDSDVNLILTHKLSSEWKKVGEKQMKSGAYERKGFDEMGHLVQANLFAYRAPLAAAAAAQWKYKVGTGEAHEWLAEPRAAKNDLGFRLRVLDSRHDPNLEGLELQNEDATFANIASMLIEGTTPDDWADVA